MGKTNRWMTWVLEESAHTDVTMPWARGTRPDWRKRLAVEAPGLSLIVEGGFERSSATRRSVSLPNQVAS